jgi:hypothetical protein
MKIGSTCSSPFLQRFALPGDSAQAPHAVIRRGAEGVSPERANFCKPPQADRTLVGAFFTARQLKVSRKQLQHNVEASREQHRLDRQQQELDRQRPGIRPSDTPTTGSRRIMAD